MSDNLTVSWLQKLSDQLTILDDRQTKTNELLEKLISLLENPPAQHVVHTNINCKTDYMFLEETIAKVKRSLSYGLRYSRLCGS